MFDMLIKGIFTSPNVKLSYFDEGLSDGTTYLNLPVWFDDLIKDILIKN